MTPITPEVHQVPQQIEPIRLQEYGVGIFQSCATKSALKKAIKANRITVNDRLAQTATIISGGEIIVYTPEIQKKSQRKFQLELQVIYEDEVLAAIHKPAGVLVSGNSFKTIANALAQNLTPSQYKDATQPHPVHRLDYATTGVLLIGKTKSSIRLLNKLFEENRVQKTYYAITMGSMSSNGSITDAIDGKPAHTNYEVASSVTSQRFGTLNLLRIRLESGRRHQIRKHLAGIGNPILGDRDYSEPSQLLKGKGMYLHAYSIAFPHPETNEHVTLIDPLPGRFGKIFPNYTD
ncbi:MAG: RluA family pseudouridine synthase [Flavobacteriaceae bacterium]|nr:RluA family pseudouridine synthase [Flavobacteriaceae bacterium]